MSTYLMVDRWAAGLLQLISHRISRELGFPISATTDDDQISLRFLNESECSPIILSRAAALHDK